MVNNKLYKILLSVNFVAIYYVQIDYVGNKINFGTYKTIKIALKLSVTPTLTLRIQKHEHFKAWPILMINCIACSLF